MIYSIPLKSPPKVLRNLKKLHFIYVFAYVRAHVCQGTNGGQKRTFRSWFSSYHMGPRDQTKVIRCGGKHPQPLRPHWPLGWKKTSKTLNVWLLSHRPTAHCSSTKYLYECQPTGRHTPHSSACRPLTKQLYLDYAGSSGSNPQLRLDVNCKLGVIFFLSKKLIEKRFLQGLGHSSVWNTSLACVRFTAMKKNSSYLKNTKTQHI